MITGLAGRCILVVGWTLTLGNALCAEYEGCAEEKIENHKDASAVLRIAVLPEETASVAFCVENTGEHDVLIHAIRHDNSYLKVKKPNGEFLDDGIRQESKYQRIKPGKNVVHTKFMVPDWLKIDGLTDSGFYEIQFSRRRSESLGGCRATPIQ